MSTPSLRFRTLPEPKREEFTDDGNALRFIKRKGDILRFNAQRNSWLVWDGKRWQVDDHGVKVLGIAREFVRSLGDEAKSVDDERMAAKIFDHARRSQYRRAVDGMIYFARSDERIQVRVDDLDSHPYLLNVQNGTIDLRTGELHKHDRSQLLTKIAPLRYDPEARAPRWKQFLLEIMDGKPDMVSYLQRAFGYAATGEIREQAIFFPWGIPGTGKSTTFDHVRAVFGEFAIEGSHDLLLTDRRDSHSTSFTDLNGVRFVKLTEVDKGRRLAEALVKKLTGDKRFRARRMRENDVEFTNTAKFFVLCNDKPRVSGSDEAVWDRIQLIPFDVRFRGTAKEDKQLDEKLLAEKEGIFAWIVRGARRWYEDGLKPPSTVRAAVREWQREEDAVHRFIDEQCTTGHCCKAMTDELYKEYAFWLDKADGLPLSRMAFGRELDRLGYPVKRTKHGAQRQGVRMKGGS